MSFEPVRERAPARLRRARRGDIARLIDAVGGPPPDRLRSLRRLLKTLAADVYVLESGEALLGVVAVLYRRSLAHGGLVATIDALSVFTGGADGPERADAVARLVDCATRRALRRGCVAIDTALGDADADVAAALEAAGFAPVATHRLRPLGSADGATAARHERGKA